MNLLKRRKRTFPNALLRRYPGIVPRQDGVAACRAEPECSDEFYRIRDVGNVIRAGVLVAHHVSFVPRTLANCVTT